MSTPNIPENYQSVMPYLIVKNAAGFRDFMKKVFDAKETHTSMRDEHTIAHGEIMVGGSTIMFSEALEDWQPQNAGLFVYVNNADATYQKAIDAGAESIMPPADQSYRRSSGVIDPYGNTWWITHPL